LFVGSALAYSTFHTGERCSLSRVRTLSGHCSTAMHGRDSQDGLGCSTEAWKRVGGFRGS